MLSYIISALYYIIPAAALLFFIVSLVRYREANHKNKIAPGTYSPEQIRSRKICLIISSVIAGMMAAVVLAFMGLLMMAVAFM